MQANPLKRISVFETLKHCLSLVLVVSLVLGPTSGRAENDGDNDRDHYERALGRIKHIVVIYQENWSFDALYGRFPGARGINNASPTSLTQVDRLGNPYKFQLGTNNFIRISSAAPQLSTPPLRACGSSGR